MLLVNMAREVGQSHLQDRGVTGLRAALGLNSRFAKQSLSAAMAAAWPGNNCRKVSVASEGFGREECYYRLYDNLH